MQDSYNRNIVFTILRISRYKYYVLRECNEAGLSEAFGAGAWTRFLSLWLVRK